MFTADDVSVMSQPILSEEELPDSDLDLDTTLKPQTVPLIVEGIFKHFTRNSYN